MRSLLMASGLALVLLANPSPAMAIAPATGAWTRIGPAAPALFGPSRLEVVRGSKIGPDGRLYVYGTFSDAGGNPNADNLAVYDGATDSWLGVGSNGSGNGAINGPIWDITWLGGVLFVGGGFADAGGVTAADFLAAWDGTAWSARTEDGLAAFNGDVYSLSIAAGLLYVAGAFTDVGGVATADGVVTWDGYAWSPLAGGGALDGDLDGEVYRVVALSGDRVYAGGAFQDAAADPTADMLALWNGSSWSGIGSNGAGDGAVAGSGIVDIAVSGSLVYVAGPIFNTGGDDLADGIALWTGTAWTHLGSSAAGTAPALDAGATSITLYGSNVVVAGSFSSAAGVAHTGSLAVWNGSKWMAASTIDPNGVRRAQAVGRTLYVAGTFIGMAAIPGADGVAALGLAAPPTAPRSPVATAGTRRVTLGWSAPATTNGAAIRDYVVQFRKKGLTTWKTFTDGVRTTRSATVTGLTSGVTYEFRISAANDWGVGTSSKIIAKRAG